MTRVSSLFLAALLLLSPWRAACAAETAHDFAKWEKDIAAFEEKDRANPPPKGGLLFIGSSTVVRWKTLAQDFAGYQVINRAFGGNEIEDSTYFADRMIFPYEPRMILLRAGGNDIHSGKSPERVFEDFKAFVAKIRTHLPDAEIVFISIGPAPVRWAEADKAKAANALIAEYIKATPGVKYVETFDLTLGPDGQPRPEFFAEDRLHFSAEGNKLLAERVRPALPK